jgi:hypothetical protein
MSDKLKVKISVEAKIRAYGECEMTREEYDKWCERVDSARGGWERETVAEELMMEAKMDITDGSIEDLEIEDFVAPETLKTSSA